MSSVSSARAISTDISMALQQGAKQTATDLQQRADRLDAKKENVLRDALSRIQDANRTAEKIASAQNRIDVYA